MLLTDTIAPNKNARPWIVNGELMGWLMPEYKNAPRQPKDDARDRYAKRLREAQGRVAA